MFRGSDIVLLGNDPWARLFLVEYALTEGSLVVVEGAPWSGELLLTWTLAFVTFLVGGVEQAPLVLAWYPVVTGVLTALVVGWLAWTLTDDIRIALASVVAVGITPLFVSRTTLGFADHHAFDYLWLVLTATAMTWLVVRTDRDSRQRWAVGGVLAVAVASQTLAWEASPLMLVPAAAALGVCSVLVVRSYDFRESIRVLAPIVAGFGGAAVLTLVVHLMLNWHSIVVAGSPGLLFLGGAFVLAAVAGVTRAGRSWPTLVAVELVAVGIGGLVVWLLVPGFVESALGRVDAFVAYVQFYQQTSIGETAPLTTAYGPVLGFIIMLGYTPFLGFPAMLWSVVHGWRAHEPGWYVATVYVLWFLGLAFVQRRFAVQLGVFLSVFAGLGFVWFVHWLALVDIPVPFREKRPSLEEQPLRPPERERLALLGGIGLVGIGGGTLFSGLITSRLTTEETAYRAAVWMREHAAKRGWEYPQNYVLTEWWNVRMYNYFVNGQSRSRWYADQHYEEFLFDNRPDEWYEEFKDRVGFILIRDIGNLAGGQMYSRLFTDYGSATYGTDGLAHYRAVWESEDEERKVFTVVPGATITGSGPAGTTFEATTDVTIEGSEKTVEYQRVIEPDEDGQFSVTVAQPGEYQFGDRVLTVPESAVLNGETITLSTPVQGRN